MRKPRHRRKRVRGIRGHTMNNTKAPSRSQPATAQRSRDESSDKHKLKFPFWPVPMAVLKDERITSSDALIIGRIAFAANGELGLCILANKTIAADTGLSEAYVERRLKHIQQRGYIHRRIERNGTRSGIDVNWERLKCDFATRHESGQVTPHENGQVPPTKVGTEENSDENCENSLLAGAKYYDSEIDDRVRINDSSPLASGPKKRPSGTLKRNRRDLVGTQEIDRALHEELAIQGLPASPSDRHECLPIKHVREIPKISWWPHKPWSEFLDHRRECGLENSDAAVIALAREVVEIHEAGHDVAPCLKSSLHYNGFHVARPKGTYPDDWSWSE